MKQLRKIIMCSFILIMSLNSCSKNEKIEDTQFAVEIEDITKDIDPNGKIISFKINSIGKWAIVNNEPWIKITPLCGEGASVCTMVVDSTVLADESRRGMIQIVSDDEVTPKEISITQKGYEKGFEILDNSEIELPGTAEVDDRYVNIKVKTNLPLTLTASDKSANWTKYELENIPDKLNRGYRPRIVNLKILWSPNSRPEERKLEYYIKPIPSDLPLSKYDTLYLKQNAAKAFEPTRAGDSLAILACVKAFNIYNGFDPAEKMHNWEGVTLWEDSDEDVRKEDIGRVKTIAFSGIKISDEIPYEIRYLNALEELVIRTNGNKMLKSLSTGESLSNLKRLKRLQLYSIGIDRLDPSFKNLGKTLEALDLAGNNLEDIPSEINQANFPHLKHLDLGGQRRYSITNFSSTPRPESEWGGMYKLSSYKLQTLFSWSKLEYLNIQNNYFSLVLPDMKKATLPKWEKGDIYEYWDSENKEWRKTEIPAILYNTPKVLPNAKILKLNLNFFYGDLPDWILYHPNLMIWDPAVFIFSHQENGINKNGLEVGFDNVPKDPEYYYTHYPEQRLKEQN